MQHLDEGMIHSWLDGALGPDDAARAQAHVSDCPECAAAVAEARGFIAASSRILTALDNAPRGVLPMAAPGKRVDPWVWRVAATVLVVAAGTLAVLRNGPRSELSDAVLMMDSAKANPEPKPATPVIVQGNPTRIAAQQNAAAGERQEVVSTNMTAVAKAAAPKSTPVTTAVPQALVPTSTGAVAASDAAGEPEPLKVVGSPRRIGAKVTLYEVAPSDTVTLTESVPRFLSSIVIRGATTAAPAAQQTRERSAAAPSKLRADAAASPAEAQTTSGAAAGAAVTSAPAPPAGAMPSSVHTITWTDSAGNTLTLSGRMPEARLQEIRMRIERERAAAAKKNP